MKRSGTFVLGIALLAMLTLTGLPSAAAEEVKGTGYRGSYFMNGEIHVNEYGTPEGKPLTSGHQDFKPSWSKTGDMLVFFRRLKNDPVVTNWKTAIHIINVDGTGLHPLSDGTHTDFNQTWTRDGTNTPIWNRKHPEKGQLPSDGEQGGQQARPGDRADRQELPYLGLHLSDRRQNSRPVRPPEAGLGLFSDDARSAAASPASNASIVSWRRRAFWIVSASRQARRRSASSTRRDSVQRHGTHALHRRLRREEALDHQCEGVRQRGGSESLVRLPPLDEGRKSDRLPRQSLALHVHIGGRVHRESVDQGWGRLSVPSLRGNAEVSLQEKRDEFTTA